MSTEVAAVVVAVEETRDGRLRLAARRLYEAELALHEARQTRVDRWIAAAYDRLHEAAVNYRFELATRDC
jgi:hypothetical protein